MKPGEDLISDRDRELVRRAVELALEAERQGSLPVGAVIVMSSDIIAEAGNRILPSYHPARHAEMEALRRVPPSLWPHAEEMTCYTTLEPCIMCFGALTIHGVGRVVFGSLDRLGGAGCLFPHLPEYFRAGRRVPRWDGPALPELCDPLYERTSRIFDALPCGLGAADNTGPADPLAS